MRGWVNFCWVLTIISSIAAATELFGAMVATTAPAQAGAAAVACGLAIVPYVFTRAFDLWDRGEQIDAIRTALDAAAGIKQGSVAASDLMSPAELLASRGGG